VASTNRGELVAIHTILSWQSAVLRWVQVWYPWAWRPMTYLLRFGRPPEGSESNSNCHSCLQDGLDYRSVRSIWFLQAQVYISWALSGKYCSQGWPSRMLPPKSVLQDRPTIILQLCYPTEIWRCSPKVFHPHFWLWSALSLALLCSWLRRSLNSSRSVSN